MTAFDKFRESAVSSATELAIDKELIEPAAEALEVAFPDEWLNVEQILRPRGLGTQSKVHPLSSLMAPMGHQQITGLLELGTYLADCSEEAGIDELHAALRGDSQQFEHTRLQLAFGNRFRSAGVDAFHFEPATEGGRKADFAFAWEGEDYAAECYRPALAGKGAVEVEQLMKQSKKVLERIGFASDKERTGLPLVAELRLTTLPDTEARKEIVAAVSRLASDMKNASDRGLLPTGMRDLIPEFGNVLVRRGEGSKFVRTGQPLMGIGAPDRGPAPTVVLAGRSMRMAQSPSGESGTDVLGEYAVHLWLPPVDPDVDRGNIESPLLRLADRLEKKLAQARSGGARRLLIVDTGLTVQLQSANDPRLGEFRRRLTVKHKGVAGVLLVSRRWHEKNRRWGYMVVTVANKGPDALPVDLVRSLQVWSVL